MENSIRNIRLEKLMEREKELNCLYATENLLINDERPLEKVLHDLAYAIPHGWQHPTVCECRIIFDDQFFQTEDFVETEHMQTADIIVEDHMAGRIDIAYTQLIRLLRGSAFLPEEQKLLNTIAITLAKAIFRRKLKLTLDYFKSSKEETPVQFTEDQLLNPDSDQHWKWRNDIVNKITEHIDIERFGLYGLYLIGSTKNASAGPGSDIDFLAHSKGDKQKMNDLRLWMQGWGLCLNEINFLKSGYTSSDSLIDLHIITDEDIRKNNSYACLINAKTDRAKPLKVENKNP